MKRYYLILFLMFLMNSIQNTLSSPFYRLFDHQNSHFDHEQCFFQSKQNEGNTVHYGQCTSTNGPDGCCLEGHYEPGICSNLGHICCVKPDFDCSKMRNNKAITRQMLQRQKMMFMKKNSGSESEIEQPAAAASRLVRSNNVPPKHQIRLKTNFEIIEMPAHMTHDAITFVNDALEQNDGNIDDAADFLCRMLDQKYPESSSWACFVGKEYGYSVEPADGKYMLFYIGNVERIRVMAFVPKAPPTAASAAAAIINDNTGADQ